MSLAPSSPDSPSLYGLNFLSVFFLFYFAICHAVHVFLFYTDKITIKMMTDHQLTDSSRIKHTELASHNDVLYHFTKPKIMHKTYL